MMTKLLKVWLLSVWARPKLPPTDFQKFIKAKELSLQYLLCCQTLTNEEIMNLMNYGQLTNPNAPAIEEKKPDADEKEADVKQDMPPAVPKKASEEDLDAAMNELTKKKE